MDVEKKTYLTTHEEIYKADDSKCHWKHSMFIKCFNLLTLLLMVYGKLS